jgi:hypothetical protein
MSPEERTARKGRDRSKPGISAETIDSWKRQAVRWERVSLTWLRKSERAKKPEQADRLLALALKAHDASDKIWFRIHRVAPPTAKPAKPSQEPGSPAQGAPSIDDYARSRGK